MLLDIVERQVGPEITVVSLNGKLALGRESQRIETLVDELAARGARRVIFDLSGVTYIDSAGVGMMALASGKLKQAGGTLVVVAAEGKVLQLLNQTQMTALFPVCRSVDAALEIV